LLAAKISLRPDREELLVAAEAYERAAEVLDPEPHQRGLRCAAD
jgi:hypothetical protein